MSGAICDDNRFKIIEKAKRHLIEATNIETSQDEMKVLDSFLFRCWQMGWLNKYDNFIERKWIPFTFEYDKELKKEILNCQLPDEDEEILVSDGHHVWLDIFMCDYDECYLESNDDFKGLAWMPLPEPYKGE